MGGDPMVVLAVDDDDDDHLIYQNDLSSHFELLSAYTADEARNLLANHKVDIILVDIVLGEISGLDLAEEFCWLYPEKVIIITTGRPDKAVEKISDSFDGCIIKGKDASYLRSVLKEAVHRKRALQRENLSSAIKEACQMVSGWECEGHCEDSLTGTHFHPTCNDASGVSERWLARVEDGSRSAGVIYRLAHQSENRITFGLPSTKGCGLGCKFCMAGNKPYKGGLEVCEMLGFFLIISNSILADFIFERPDQTEVVTSQVCEGDAFRNLHNVMRMIEILSHVRLLKVRSKVTSIGFEKMLEVYLREYAHLPWVKNIRHSWSVHSFRSPLRHWLMPATVGHDFNRTLELYSEIAKISQEQVTLNTILIKETLDREEIEAIARKIGNRGEFRVQLQPCSGAPGFHPLVSATPEEISEFGYHLGREIGPERVDERDIIGGQDYGGCGTTLPEKYPDRKLISCKEAR